MTTTADTTTALPADYSGTRQDRIDHADKRIRHLTWVLETYLPSELAATNHARRLASLRRQAADARKELSKATSDLSSAVQEPRD